MTADFTPAQVRKLAEFESAAPAPESLRERVAVALFHAEDAAADWSYFGDEFKAPYRSAADAAIAVMRGPDDASAALRRVMREMEALADVWTSYGGPDTQAGVAADLLRRHLRAAVEGS